MIKEGRGRKSKLDAPGWLLNPKIKAMFKDLYKGMSEGEAMILDIILANAILRDVMGVKAGEEATERQIAAVTGLSKSGARVVSGKAMERIKSKVMKGGITKLDDWIDTTGGRSNASSTINQNID